MRLITLLVPLFVVGVVASAPDLAAQVIRTEAESGVLDGDGFSILAAPFFSAEAATNAQDVNPTAIYTFAGWDGPYDITVAYCDEDDGTSSYTLSGSFVGAIASWLGDQPRGTNNCNPTSLLELTRFRGHFILWEKGVHDGEETQGVSARVSRADGRASARRAHA